MTFRPIFEGSNEGPSGESVHGLVASLRKQQGSCGVEEISDHVPGLPRKVINRPLRMHQDSSQVGNLFNPTQGIRDTQRRSGKTPVDHTRNNRSAIRQQSRANAARKVAETQQGGPVRFHAPGAIPRKSSTSGSVRAATAPGRDFVNDNIVDAGTHRKPVEKVAPDGSDFLSKPNYGRVPTYLHERNMELAAQYAKQQAQKEAALIPEGMRVMSDEERQETLAILESNRAEVEQEIQQLPFVIETPSAVKHKNRLEKRLHEIEDARKIFSRPKVLVKA